MRISLFLMGDRGGTYHDLIMQVRMADELGFLGVWLAERHLSHGDLLWPSPMVAAAYIAAQTKRIRIGLAARVLPFHHPLAVAADALTLDVLSRGRFDLGVTRGSMDDRAHAAFGVPREEAGRRFEEELEILRLALTGAPVTFRGRFYELEDALAGPPPVQRPHPPLYLVANNPQTLAMAAESGLPVFLNGALDLEAISKSAARYVARAQAAGFSPTGADLYVNRFIYVGDTNEAAERALRGPFLRFLDQRAPDLRGYLVKTYGPDGMDPAFLAREICVFGDAEYCAARLLEIRDRTGVEHVMGTFNYITMDHQECAESMARFALDVMPQLRPSIVEMHPPLPATEVMR